MLRVIVETGPDGKPVIEKALKQFKRKCNNTKLVKEMRQRQEFTKPSVTARTKKLKAIYTQKIRLAEES